MAQDLSTFFSYHPKLFLLILIPTFFQIFPIVFFCRMVNSLSGTIYFNCTSNTAYDFFPTLRPVSFKQPRYYSNQIPRFATNKEGKAVLINARRSTGKKTKNKKKHYVKERNFRKKKFLLQIFSCLSSGKFDFCWKTFSRLTIFIGSISHKFLCTTPPSCLIMRNFYSHLLIRTAQLINYS